MNTEQKTINKNPLQQIVVIQTTLMGSTADDLSSWQQQEAEPIKISGRPYSVLLGLCKTQINLISAIIAGSEGLSGDKKVARQIELIKILKEEFLKNQLKTDWDLEQENR